MIKLRLCYSGSSYIQNKSITTSSETLQNKINLTIKGFAYSQVDSLAIKTPSVVRKDLNFECERKYYQPFYQAFWCMHFGGHVSTSLTCLAYFEVVKNLIIVLIETENYFMRAGFALCLNSSKSY